MDNKKCMSAAIGAALALGAVGSCMVPVTVHADFGAFAGAVDYVAALSGAEAEAFYATAGGPVVAGIVLGTKIALEHPIVTGGDVLASNFSVCSGKYYDSELETKLGCMCAYNQGFGEVGETQVLIAYSEDYQIYYSPLPSTGASITGLGTGISAAGSQILYTALCNYSTNGGLTLGNGLIDSDVLSGSYSVTNNNMQSAFFQFNCGGGIPALGNSSIQEIASGSYYGRNRGAFIGAGTVTTLPGDADTYIDSSYPDYVYTYIQENYPEFVYIFPEPDIDETLDPSETMPGLPIIQLPTVPPPEYDLELPEKMIEGAGFWFTALTSTLEELGWLAIAIVLAVIAIVLYYVF